jgi:signal peptidase II
MRKYHFLIAALVFFLDRISKWLVATHIALHDSVVVIPGFFSLTHVQNRGAAFGLFDSAPGSWKIALLVAFSILALLVVTALLWKDSHRLSPTGIGLSLILGGALGNLWDRLIERHVVDFLYFYLHNYHWPAFNVADSAIVIGAALLVGEILLAKEEPAAES